MKKKIGTQSTPGYDIIVQNRLANREVLSALMPAKVAQIKSANIIKNKALPMELLRYLQIRAATPRASMPLAKKGADFKVRFIPDYSEKIVGEVGSILGLHQTLTQSLINKTSFKKDGHLSEGWV